MSPEMRARLEEMVNQYCGGDMSKGYYQEGFAACHDLMKEREKVLVEALERIQTGPQDINCQLCFNKLNLAIEALTRLTNFIKKIEALAENDAIDVGKEMRQRKEQYLRGLKRERMQLRKRLVSIQKSIDCTLGEIQVLNHLYRSDHE